MKRVYRNNDIKFNLTINGFPFNSEIIYDVEFKFYTKNKNNFILKNKKDIVDQQIILEWKDLAKLERGVLNYSFDAAVDNPSLSDDQFNTVSDVITNYYIMSDITDIDIPARVTEWGEINGDIKKQLDLVDYINLEIKNLNLSEYAKKIDLPTKVSQLENDSGYLTEHQDISNLATKDELPTKTSQLTNDSGFLTEHQDISSKLDKSVYESDKPTFATKTDLTSKQDTLVSGTNIKTINGNDITGSGNIEVQTKIDIDSNLSTESVNPVQNKVVTGELNKKPATITLTQSEYNLLTPEEKNKNVLYIISDAKYEYATKEELTLKADKTEIPTLTSQLTNDSGFLTEHQDISNLATKDELPTKVSQLTNDSGFLTEHQDISNLATKDELPTKTSQLTNDSGFLTEVPAEYITETELNDKGYLTEHQDISNLATKEYVDELIGGVSTKINEINAMI